ASHPFSSMARRRRSSASPPVPFSHTATRAPGTRPISTASERRQSIVRSVTRYETIATRSFMGPPRGSRSRGVAIGAAVDGTAAGQDPLGLTRPDLPQSPAQQPREGGRAGWVDRRDPLLQPGQAVGPESAQRREKLAAPLREQPALVVEDPGRVQAVGPPVL